MYKMYMHLYMYMYTVYILQVQNVSPLALG